MNNILQQDIRYLKGVGEKRAVQLNRLGVFTLGDLLYLLPRRYIDYSDPYQLAYAPYDEACAVKATVLQSIGGVRIKGGRTMFKVLCADETARLELTYFNSEYTVKQLEVGEEYIFYGKIGGSMVNRQMVSPIFIPADSPLTRRAVYPLTAGLSAALRRAATHSMRVERRLAAAHFRYAGVSGLEKRVFCVKGWVVLCFIFDFLLSGMRPFYRNPHRFLIRAGFSFTEQLPVSVTLYAE